ncbi:MAG: tetratricopeptide repeat protein, partial [Dysgonamonadaceae bacterium]|nr:tetratricopeptide repeat protein [Dysgonamonadaceae bacterium]
LKDRRYFSESRSGEPSRLYRQTKIQSEWTPPVPVEIPIDSAGSDAFPFIMPDGLTLYFASTGNGSIGGYDIFAARYNLSNSTYLTPSQLGMPFNSTSNDYLYAIDESKGVGYFATDRFQEEGKVIIYTFIPNESFKPIERATIDRLVSRARINSIRDTWPEGSKGNTSLKETEHYPTAVKKDFTFVINDNIVYHIPKDFESDAARRSWQAAKDATIQINELEEQIDSLRLNYSLGNRQQRRTLMPKILSAESKLEQLHRQCREKTKEARNLEIRSLRMK